MAFAGKKLNLELYFNMCMAEYETSVRNIEHCKEKAEHIFDIVTRQWDSPSDMHKCLESYHKALTDLSHLSDMLRKFNIQFELDSLADKTKETNDERFTYPQPDLVGYDVGYESECVITYVKDAKNKLFYMKEIGSPSCCIVNMQNYFQNSPKELDNAPSDGEVFGLYLEGYMFRAVKENCNADKFSNFKAYLIDVGEIVTINENMTMYALSETDQQFPAEAILCKLEQVNSNQNIVPSQYLTKCLYTKHKFRITGKDRSLLFVNLHADTNPFRNMSLCDSNNKSGTNEKPPEPLTNPFKRYLCIKTKIDRIDFSEENNSKKCVSIEKSVIINEHSIFDKNTTSNNNIDVPNYMNGNVNYFDSSGRNGNLKNVCFDNELNSKDIRPVLNSVHTTKGTNSSNSLNGINKVTENLRNNHFNDVPPGFNFKPPKSNKLLGSSAIGMEQLTEEERNILYEEPLNTTNAMKAVMGYDPKDDKRICQFYNSKNDSCFKGAHCKMEHVEKLRDGWTRDEAPTTVDIPNKIVYPHNGDFITIIPTHILNIEYFFAQIVSHEGRYEPTLKEMVFKMNSLEVMENYKHLKTMPVQFELVIAQYTDGCWYRAKVLNTIDDVTLKVFYLDFGNSNIVTMDKIRLWDSRFDYLPFQAITCKISGVAEKRNCSIQASEQLRKMILNLNIKALVIDNVDQLDLKLWDSSGKDIGVTLISMGLADNKYAGAFKTNQRLPA